jgi:hypothetical protein
MARIRKGILEAMNSVSTPHGWRVQALFEVLVASLGEVHFLKQEDAGDVYFAGDHVNVPDFRIVTADGRHLLVDAKNFRAADPTADYRMRRKDYEGLLRYTALVGLSELKLAIYWSPWNLRTLTDVARMRDESDRLTISLLEASK